MRWQPARLALALALGPAVLGSFAAVARADGPSAAPAPTPNPSVDAQMLYCLDPANAEALVDAAVKLDPAHLKKGSRKGHLIGADGRDVTIDAWRGADWASFSRACGALIAERKLPKIPAGKSRHWWEVIGIPSWLSTPLGGSVPVVIGALIPIVGGMMTSGRNDRRRAAEALNGAVTAFTPAARACLDAWREGSGREAQGKMEAALRNLAAELRQAGRRQWTWRQPGAVADALEELGAEIGSADWTEPNERGRRARAFQDRLEVLHDRALRVAAALERPLRGWWRMRKA
ncbi:hypothetical protein [Actinomadura opuntiae]|uniref:hypothetical protein n=1 Tax=Actinomadura sp. OS1-43 TaxID=604315 RepID=UPI00255AE387|nr:hypothetical protein [Actinomadura sp. OS1-43]MDL4813637.1 hypothetical protein [Actinomadura sp. OS1-43]